jgi:ribosome biogenesis protein BMS1
LTDIKGPITVVSGKKRRLTFMECNNDMNSMIDVAKVADLVLLMIDASFGFEMVKQKHRYKIATDYSILTL